MFEQLKSEIVACRLCAERFGFEPHPILTGNAKSKIMQISQAPIPERAQDLAPV